ncbi:MAG: hypothetical protein JXB47_02725 [Anaerolineae bacterium]|nr:hypothetical protein [Anaerolineae bacterium]
MHNYKAIGVLALALMAAACGPADRLPPMNPPLEPRGDVPAWEPAVWPTIEAEPAFPVDASLLTGEPCAPPCWQGLKPGVTALQEVRAFLENSPFVADWREAAAPADGALYAWDWAAPEPSVRPNTLLVRGDLLAWMTLWPVEPAALEAVTGKFGPPAKVDLLDPATTGQAAWSMDLYYPAHGLRLTISDLAAGGGALCPAGDAAVQAVMYLPSGDLEGMIAAIYPNPVEQQDVIGRLLDWDGVNCLPLVD